jgi:ADP-ribosylglycohydrolase
MDHSVRTPSHTPLERALCSLEGLSVGDAFGERFFVHPDTVDRLIAARALPAPPWRFTADTQMALSIVAVLRRHGRIDQDHLAQHFAAHYDPLRGYGPAITGSSRASVSASRGRPLLEACLPGRARSATARPCASRPSARIMRTTWTPPWNRPYDRQR